MPSLIDVNPATRPEAGPGAHRILAIDYGRKRIGLALSDELGLTASPLSVLLRKNRQDDLKRLRAVCSRYAVGHIIVGEPVHITGEASEMAGEARRFANRLSKAVGIETEMVDERLTSWEARRTVKGRETVDDVAAAVLLRDYLARHARPAEKD